MSISQTKAQLRVTAHSWPGGFLAGDVRAGGYEWQFQWNFRAGKLRVQPSLGRSLIFEPLGRFLERSDYQLEPGGDYEFTVRAKL